MSLSTLPAELLLLIQSHLTTKDIKHLRLSCSKLRDLIEMRIDRVFLSANPRNVEVFLAIAAHEEFRHFVTEIVWDDAILTPIAPRESSHEGASDDISISWFVEHCQGRRQKIEHWWQRSKKDDFGPHGHSRAEDSFEYYKKLVKVQDELRQSGHHVNALHIGVRRFPALRRITITPDAHGGIHNPRYPSPMIREFPSGFIYPIPGRWTLHGPGGGLDIARLSAPWHQLTEAERNRWEGVRTVLKLLAGQSQNGLHVSELVLDTGILPTGISHRIFEAPCDEFNDLATVISHPDFRRLDLAVAIDSQVEWSGQRQLFISGQFRQALSAATGLEYFKLQANSVRAQFDNISSGRVADNHIPPLIHVFPVDCWPRLRHFGLSSMCVRSNDIITLFKAMPRTLRSIELDRLHFRSGKGSYAQILAEAKYLLGWRRRQKHEQIKLAICTSKGPGLIGPFVRVFDEVQDYLYGEGPAPFNGNEYVGYEPESMVKFEFKFT